LENLDNAIMLVRIESAAADHDKQQDDLITFGSKTPYQSDNNSLTLVNSLLQFKLIGWSMADVLSCATLSSHSTTWEDIPLTNKPKTSQKGLKFPKFNF
jgi:hypothetical protein